MIVRIAVYCRDEDLDIFRKGIESYRKKNELLMDVEFFQDSIEFLHSLERDSAKDLVIVSIAGARGMEAVISAREVLQKTPLLWCSEDAYFAVSSYRLRCTLFLVLPLTAEDVEKALQRCIPVQEEREVYRIS